MTKANIPAIKSALTAIQLPDGVFEIRAFDYPKSKTYTVPTMAGYFTDIDKAAASIANLNQKTTVYMTVNPINPRLLARANNRIKERPKSLTGDDDIISRRWIMIDTDPKRPSGISATDEEVQHALTVRDSIIEHLTGEGWEPAIVAKSGNGGHVMYRVDLPADEPTTTVIGAFLDGLADRFNTDAVDVDRKVFNLSRIWKVYGTVATKGDPMPDNIHRLATIETNNTDSQPITIEQIISATDTPKPTARPVVKATEKRPFSGGQPITAGDIDAALSNLGIDYKKKDSKGKTVWKLERCLTSDAHTDGAAVTLQGGVPGYICHHNTCTGNGMKGGVYKMLFPDRVGNGKTAVNQQAETFTLDDIINQIKAIQENKAELKAKAVNDALKRIPAKCGYLDPIEWDGVLDILNSLVPAKKTLFRNEYARAVKAATPKLTIQDKILNTLSSNNYLLQLNMMDDQIHVNGELLNDVNEAKMIVSTRATVRARFSDTFFRQVMMTEADNHQIHPIRDGLNALPKWDGKPRLDAHIATWNFEDAKQNQLYKRWQLGMIGKAFDLTQNFIIIVDGNQGIGKSSRIRWDNPLKDYHLEAHFNPLDKDHKIRMARYFCHEIGELQAVTRKSDRESLKSAITEQYITERAPYGRYEMHKPVMVNFAGTINNTGVGFLNDPSGHRRYAVVKSKRIDWNYTDNDNRMIWAELMHLYFEEGERGILTPEEAKYRDESIKDYEVSTSIAELFETHFMIGNDGMEYLSATDILSVIAGRVGGQISDMNKRGLEEHLTKMENEKRIPSRVRRRKDGGRVFVYPNIIPRPTRACTCENPRGCDICTNGWVFVDEPPVN